MNYWLKYIFRLVVSAIAVYIVSRKIDLRVVADLAGNVSLPMLFVSILVYNCSQVISSQRLSGFLKVVDPTISELWNLRLYYRGMFYNLFLPGSVTGDAYKVVVLKRRSGGSYNLYITAILLDRLTGLMLIFVIIGLLFLFTTAGKHVPVYLNYISVACLFLPILLWFVVSRYLNRFRVPLFPACLLSLAVQFLQLASLGCILHALGVEPGQYLTYALMFYVSSLVSAIPFTMGGLGARELVFMTGSAWFGLQQPVAVSAAFLFFLVVALSSLVGAWLPVENKNMNVDPAMQA
ncbi:lysylphosphatidylglycerol synthase transmembrane domain-containing protein [Flavihumibacter solisilvae]|uniref:lysylphosphatidylglycerol synthase transmembrane domain-containing protein n=1 Tax=Flavihumibacter solisilvae TaxID=1349421 RepID=UPI0006895671|nr:lysylphosphatidylglycerol synthase transmembrane domain-containing protein [Flavihumibacter solisilvae]